MSSRLPRPNDSPRSCRMSYGVACQTSVKATRRTSIGSFELQRLETTARDNAGEATAQSPDAAP